jgi:uncharacterized membrane protein
MQESPKSLRERILHACLYEAIALLLCTPLFAWLTSQPMMAMGALNVMISALALLWNMLFNAIYERMLVRWQWRKTPTSRIVHGVCFEGGLGIVVIPLSAWWLDISFAAALALDIGILLFFLPYTVIFNWLYDIARARILAPPIAKNLKE